MSVHVSMAPPQRSVSRGSWLLIVSTLVTTAVLVTASYLWKSLCIVPPFGPTGGSSLSIQRATGALCYTDIQSLWGSRDLIAHALPYIHGTFVAPSTLGGGTVEYPVLGGVWIWASALLASNDAEFLLINAIALGATCLVITSLLVRLAGKRALIWAAAPALVLYAVYNWDAPAVLAVVLALWWVLKSPGALAQRSGIAAIFLGLGTAFKLYPALFVIPLGLAVLWHERAKSGRIDQRGLRRALAVPAIAAGVVSAVNLPFMIVGFAGWKAALDFQSHRPLTMDTMSMWFWGLRLIGNPSSDRILPLVNAASASAVVVAAGLLAFAGWRIARHSGRYPWLEISAASLCAYMLLNKVNSPQYILWLIPFFVILRVSWPLIVAYFVVDVTIYVSWFLYIHSGVAGAGQWWWDPTINIAVVARAVLLALLIGAFLLAGRGASARPWLSDRGPGGFGVAALGRSTG